MVVRLAREASPVASDAPAEEGYENPVAYDPGLLAQLEEHGPAALEEFGMIVVRDVGDTARYNSAVWYALAHDLVYEQRDGCVVVTDPKGAA